MFILQEYASAGTIRENFANILVLLLRLRQACDHPLLLKGKEKDLIDTGSVEVAKKLPKETVINLLGQLEGDYAICSRCSVSNLITYCTCKKIVLHYLRIVSFMKKQNKDIRTGLSCVCD